MKRTYSLAGLSILVMSLTISKAFSESLDVTCVGSPNAKNKVIYLHGADTYMPGVGEQWTKHFLTIMAERLDLQIAMPRSKDPCPPDAAAMFPGVPSFCWENDDYDKLISEVLDSSKKCFDTGKEQGFGVIGFSTGARLVNRWMIYSEKYGSLPQWFVPVGVSAGYFLSPKIKARIKERSPKVSFVMGKYDPGFGRAFFNGLKTAGANAEFFEFEGGHVFEPMTVEQAVSRRVAPAPVPGPAPISVQGSTPVTTQGSTPVTTQGSTPVTTQGSTPVSAQESVPEPTPLTTSTPSAN